jgi:hypothetical protein
LAKVPGEVAFSREVWYYGTVNMEERSEIDGKWEISVVYSNGIGAGGVAGA